LVDKNNQNGDSGGIIAKTIKITAF